MNIETSDFVKAELEAIKEGEGHKSLDNNRHHSIIVISWDTKELKEAYDIACGVFLTVSNIRWI